MQFKLIQDITNWIYTNIEFAYLSDLHLSITTNLTLLTDDMLDFLHIHNFNLNVSLDGPENENDKNRIFTDSTGTFNIIYNNLKKIKNKYQDYYNKSVTILAVEAPNLNNAAVKSFFESENNDMFLGNIIYSDLKEPNNVIASHLINRKFNYESLRIYNEIENIEIGRAHV